jgi:monothiol glutaredoxin
MSEAPVSQRIEEIVKSDTVVLFMKGTRNAPQCGFSATVVSILDQYVPSYTTVNVLADQELREGVKEYANWPTIPQLYVRGEFLGGCDIVRQMDEQGELLAVLGDVVEMPAPPAIEVTEAAAAIFGQALSEAEQGERLRITVDAHFQHDLALDTPRPSDLEVEAGGLRFILDPASARRANGLRIDYVSGPETGFKMDNPNAPVQVQQISPADARALLAAEPGAWFIDVRTPQEREIAKIDGTRLLPDVVEELLALPKDTPVVFHCHHGTRSYMAAIDFLERGFTRVYNVVGGIDAWSKQIDPEIPQY